ncbi:divalent-cation tolerance protein CutA [Glycomyces paridis]|uniref:Divalent-cation tolerance protein CutA n=1 Tax=Glycomyces paridis TaxID=2126555 RepID=A0A4V4HNR8_9ACTN|nr:divalent-cation tolerance protein CutA [Glycomyces paridis]
MCEVVITAPDAGWLREFTRRLVAERLAACGHNLAEIRSIYRWDGSVQEETEARVMLHTRQSLVAEIVAATNREHPYDVPCVLSMPVVEANPDYQAWVVAETREPSSGTGVHDG